MRVLAFALLAAVAGGCAYAPPQAPPTYSQSAADHGRLHGIDARVEADLAPGESAFWLLHRNDAALAYRLALAEGAVETLDVQTFIWNGEPTSLYLARRVIAAADRGVRVRFLLDDVATDGLDRVLAVIDMHPDIEVRLFNPWRGRSRPARLAEFFMRLGTLNHRMHNKTMIADGHFAILGGRNVGDHYFGLAETFVQNDLDVLMNGPVVEATAEQFDVFWNSAEAYPIERVINRRDVPTSYEDELAEIEAAYLAERELLAEFIPSERRAEDWLDALVGAGVQGRAVLLVDSPDIDAQPPTQLYEDFKSWLAEAEHEVLLSSPYFVPDREFVDLLEELTVRGVHVVVLTNSLASNNHATAHTGYKKWRREVLRAGVELYELRPDAEMIPYFLTPPAEADRIGLHSKMAVVDGRSSYIGSANVDPRSMIINTEIGVLVESEELASRLEELFVRDTAPVNAWRVRLTEDNWLTWTSAEGTVMRQPARGFTQRFVEFVLNLLPLKNQG